MRLSRRSLFAGLAAGFALDPDRLLWVKGAKHYSIPARRVEIFQSSATVRLACMDSTGYHFHEFHYFAPGGRMEFRYGA
jgi:hypothetical protein